MQGLTWVISFGGSGDSKPLIVGIPGSTIGDPKLQNGDPREVSSVFDEVALENLLVLPTHTHI